MDAQSLLIGGLSLGSGLVMLILPRKSRVAAEAKVAIRKSQLAAGASERFFEELRTLETYPIAKIDGRWRIKGAFFTAAGIILLGLSSFR